MRRWASRSASDAHLRQRQRAAAPALRGRQGRARRRPGPHPQPRRRQRQHPHHRQRRRRPARRHDRPGAHARAEAAGAVRAAEVDPRLRPAAEAGKTLVDRIEPAGADRGRRLRRRQSPERRAQRRIRVLLPNRLSIRSTAISAVRLRTSSAGLSSITSSERHGAGVGDHLHAQLRLAVGRPALDGGADAGGDVGVEEIDVEADVQVGVGVDRRQRQLHGVAHAHLVDVAHVEDLEAVLVHELLLAGVDAADADLPHPLRADRRHLAADLDQLLRAEAAQAGDRHAVDVAARRELVGVEVGVGVEPEDAQLLVRSRGSSGRRR